MYVCLLSVRLSVCVSSVQLAWSNLSQPTPTPVAKAYLSAATIEGAASFYMVYCGTEHLPRNVVRINISICKTLILAYVKH